MINLFRMYVIVSLLLVVGVIISLCGYMVYQGLSIWSVTFFVEAPSGMPPGTDGGIGPAIIGTIALGLVTAIISSVLSIPCALSIVYGNIPRQLRRLVLVLLRSILGIPSIIMGLFGYSFYILYVGLDRSLLVSALTLGTMIMPFITLRLVKVFSEFPKSTYEAAQYLGLGPAYIWIHLVIPARRQSIGSTIALGCAYAMGATAPILYTGVVLYMRGLPSLTDPFMSLSYHLYILVNEGYGLDMAYGTALVLLVILWGIQLFCRALHEKI